MWVYQLLIALIILKHTFSNNVSVLQKNYIFSLTGDLLGKVMLLLLKNDDFDKACKIMDKLDRDHQTVAGVPKIEVLELFIDHCIERKMPTRAIVSIIKVLFIIKSFLNPI